MTDAAKCIVGYHWTVPTELPFVTRREIAREYRLESDVTEASAIRALRIKHALSPGVTVEMRANSGKLGGRLHVYSALNRDAARALRRHDADAAVRLSRAAAEVEGAPETRRLVAAMAVAGAATAAEIARALSAPAMARDIALVERRHNEARARVVADVLSTILVGHVAGLNDAGALLLFPHHNSRLTIPRLLVDDAGVATVGTAIAAIWEILPGGRTLITVEPAVDNPELATGGEELVDVYGTPWGRILGQADRSALEVTGTPTVSIPDGVPEVE